MGRAYVVKKKVSRIGAMTPAGNYDILDSFSMDYARSVSLLAMFRLILPGSMTMKQSKKRT